MDINNLKTQPSPRHNTQDLAQSAACGLLSAIGSQIPVGDIESVERLEDWKSGEVFTLRELVTIAATAALAVKR